MKKWIVVVWMSAIVGMGWSQETLYHQDQLDIYQEGKSFFEEGLYLQAKESLEEFLEGQSPSSDYVPENKQAELMIAQAAIYMRLNDGEKLLEEFVRKYKPERIAEEALLELADYYFNNKMYGEAIANYELVDTDLLDAKELTTVKFKQGYAYFTRDEMEKAKTSFSKIANMKGAYYEETNYYLGMLEFEDKEYAKAVKRFKNANVRGKYDRVTPYYLCQNHFALNEYDKVIQVGEKALESKKELDYENALVHLVAKSHFENGDYYKALPFFETFSENAKKLRAQDLYQVAFTHYKTNNFEKAIASFEELKTGNDEMAQNALYNLGDSYLKKDDKFSARNAFYGASKMNFDEQIQKDAHYLYAKLSYDLGFDREAIAALTPYKKGDAEYNEAQQMLGKIFMNTNDFGKAIELMDQMPNKTAKIKEAYQKVTFLKALQLFNNGKLDDAKGYFNMSLKNTPSVMNKAQAYYYLGEIAHKKGDYDTSIRELGTFTDIAKGYYGLPEETSPEMAAYTQGYNYFKKKNYNTSASYFENAINGMISTWDDTDNNDIKTRIFPDAVLRAGDCFFRLKQYDNALKYYQTSANYKYNGYDYALFQMARIEGLRGNVIDQITSLKTITNDLPNSSYADDALLLMGSTYFRERNYSKAEESILKLTKDYKQTSNLVNRGYILLGLISYNQNNNSKALSYYENVFANNPSEEEQATALESIREIYIDDNNPDGFIEFQERVLGKEISSDDKEAIVYRAAELQFESGNVEEAIAAYTKYINKYRNGRFALQSHYNRGESHLIKKRYAIALTDYDYVVSKGNSVFYERALTKAASISYNHTQDFKKSYTYYSALAKVAADDKKRFDAHMNALRSAYKSNIASGVYEEAKAVLNNSQATAEHKATAHFYKGKTAQRKKDYTTALLSFQKSAKSNTIMGAESRYQIAKIHYSQNDLTLAREKCMEHLKKSKNYESWVAEGMLLFADIALAQGDLFNARAALETLIENYKDAGTIKKAKDKLKVIEAKESEDSRIIPE